VFEGDGLSFFLQELTNNPPAITKIVKIDLVIKKFFKKTEIG
jgi:hypothetical protein